MKCTIIGKQPLKTPPKFERKNSFGLNEAALWYDTEYAFSGHKTQIKEFKRRKRERIIVIEPLFEHIIEPDCYDRILWDAVETRSYDCSVEYCLKYVKSAINKEDIPYPNRLTILHLALFYVLKQGFTHIDMIGCANNYDEFENVTKWDKSISPMMREFTKSMVEAMTLCGINVNWRKEENGESPYAKIPKLPDISVLSLKGYFKKHFQLCGIYKTQQEAWDELENIYHELTKTNRYTSFESFRAAKSRFYKDHNNR